MLLNKLPCLDKGYVAYLDSSGDSSKLQEIALEFFQKAEWGFLTSTASLTLAIKCPLFLQLHLSQYDFKIITARLSTEVEAYVPNVGEVKCKDHETAKAIAGDMERTTAALLINAKAYQTDGCDRSTSQILTPISTYTTLIVSGSYNEWKRFSSQKGVPSGIVPYVNAVQQVMQMEWKK